MRRCGRPTPRPAFEPGEERQIVPSEPAGSSSRDLLDVVTACLDDHRAVDVVVIDLQGKSSIADFMVVASGTSSRQITSMAESLGRELKKHGVVGVTPEGLKQGDWVLIDAGDVIVHLFRPEIRDFYGIEKMWGVTLAEPDRTSGTGV